MELKVSNTEGCKSFNSKSLRAPTRRYPVVLSIAGSDSSGGAGIQADLKTLSALGVYGATAITAITAQNTVGVHSQLAVAPEMVFDQIVAVIEDIKPSAIKIGMLSNAEVALAVDRALCGCDIPIILDPVMVSTSGDRLLSIEAQDVVKHRLMPRATLITPNIPEMEALATMRIATPSDKAEAAHRLIALGAKAVLLKGGHEQEDAKLDILYLSRPNGVEVAHFSTPSITTRNTHGTGCTLSAAIAAYISRGLGLKEAIGAAKGYISEAIKAGADVAIGNGFGPVNHLFNPIKMQIYEE